MTTGAALLTLGDAYDEAIWGWPAEAFDEVLGSEEEFDDAGVDEHARARVENASPYGLVARLQDTPTIAAPSSLSDTLDLLRATDRLASWAAAQRARLVAQVHTFSDREHHIWSGSTSSLVFTGTVVETAALLKLSEGSAARLVSESLSLTGDLTDTLAALEKGEICSARASVIVEQTRTVPHDAVRAFEAEILQVAGDLNRPRLTARCRRLREKLHPETLTARRVKAAADRCVVFEPDQDGMAWLNAYLPAEQALALHTAVDAAARNPRADDDPRTLPQLRADVLADLLLGTGGTAGVAAASCETCRGGGDSTDAGHTGCGARSSPAKIVVTVPVFSLMPLTDEPAELEGYGPIPADAARKLAADATSWMRLLTHPYTGAVLGLDRTRYRPSEDLRTWVQLREKTCSFYGCSRSASRCDLDHLLSWADDGSTGPDNLYPVCRRHHMLKHQTDWTPTPGPDGGLTWLSPGGRTYTTPPERHRTGRRSGRASRRGRSAEIRRGGQGRIRVGVT
ncbi:HNH endonuclease signature motif containing protein [Arthrobacter sp. MDT1-65]